ncbi:hypothetical protein [Mucilaginibacter sp. HD30]
MANDYKYPSTYEIQEVLGSITNRSFLNDFAQRRGVFITNGSQQQLASDLANLFYDDADLEKIRLEAYHNKASHTLSGFLVRSKQKDFNLKEIYEIAREGGRFEMGQQATQLHKVSKEGEELSYRGKIEYLKPKAGRMQFLQDETSAFEFYMNKKSDGLWQIEVDASRSTDVKELKNLIAKTISSDSTIELIEHALLNTEQTILFFDALAKTGMDANWLFLDTKHLTLKRGNDDSERLDNNETEADVQEVTQAAELTGITQAILQGKNLRENTFVKQSVDNGYQFTAMTYEFQHKTEPVFIQMKAEFKGKPKVFEVGIVSYEEHIGVPPRREPTPISASANRLLRSSFWNNAKLIYDKMPKLKAK